MSISQSFPASYFLKRYLRQVSMEDVCSDKDILVFAVPSIFVRSTAKEAAPYIKKGQLVVNVAKGIEDDSLKLLSEILRKNFLRLRLRSYPGHPTLRRSDDGFPQPL